MAPEVAKSLVNEQVCLLGIPCDCAGPLNHHHSVSGFSYPVASYSLQSYNTVQAM